MSSLVSWLDFSEQERLKMIEVVSLFKERDTRDEMGLGQIRDGFADLFFPGTTTLQTRARYFLFVPWIYRYYEQRGEPSASIERKVRKREIALIWALKDMNEDGVIGQVSGASLHRFPASIYWNGLRRWEILRLKRTQHQYHKSLNHYYQQTRIVPASESAEAVTDISYNWDPTLPNQPDGFPQQIKNITFDLSPEEADYLRERLLYSCTTSLLAFLVDQCAPVDTQGIHLPWMHPQATEFPEDIKDWLLHARNFSECMQGSALLYNLMLAEKRESDELVERYREWLTRWHEELCQRAPALFSWSLQDFWTLTEDRTGSVYTSTRHFVNNWLEGLFENGAIVDPADNKILRQIVCDRETGLKGTRSRLCNKRHLDLWNGDSGTAQLDYRWRIGNRIAHDIQVGAGNS
jgi:hypothetical protein